MANDTMFTQGSRNEAILHEIINKLNNETVGELPPPRSRIEMLLQEVLDKIDNVDPEAIADAVYDWLDEHPEATTTVQDGSITKAKLDSDLKGTVDEVVELKSQMTNVENAVEELEAGSLSALGASEGQVPTADGEGSWEWDNPAGGGAVQDVQVNGVSVLQDGVANVPLASASVAGVVRPDGDYGTQIVDARIAVVKAGDDQTKAGTHQCRPIVPYNQHLSTFYGLAKAAGDTTQSASSNAVGNYTESAKSAISEMLNGSVSVSGTAPAITALPGIRYVCGEVTTIDITLPASGIVDVVFTSGSTPAVLTVTPPTGQTMKWANGFDPAALEANTTYEINVMDGVYGVVGQWS